MTSRLSVLKRKMTIRHVKVEGIIDHQPTTAYKGSSLPISIFLSYFENYEDLIDSSSLDKDDHENQGKHDFNTDHNALAYQSLSQPNNDLYKEQDEHQQISLAPADSSDSENQQFNIDNRLHRENLDPFCWEINCKFSDLANINRIITPTSSATNPSSTIQNSFSTMAAHLRKHNSYNFHTNNNNNNNNNMVETDTLNDVVAHLRNNNNHTPGEKRPSLNQSVIIMVNEFPRNFDHKPIFILGKNKVDKISKIQEDNRKRLVLWLQELIHKFDSLPVEAKTSLIDLLDYSTTHDEFGNIQSLDHDVTHNNSSNNNNYHSSISSHVAAADASSTTSKNRLSIIARRLNFVKSNNSNEVSNNNTPSGSRRNSREIKSIKVTPMTSENVLKNTKKVYVSSVLKIVNKYENYLRQFLTTQDNTLVLCISRSESIHNKYSLRIVQEDIMNIIFIFLVITKVIYNILVYSQAVATEDLLLISVLCFVYLIYRDDIYNNKINNDVKFMTFGYLESVLNTFLLDRISKDDGEYNPHLIYNTTVVQPYKSITPKVLSSPFIKQSLSNAVSSMVKHPKNFFRIIKDVNNIPVPVVDVKISNNNIAAITNEIRNSNNAFEMFEFTDITPEARSLYIDRRFTHSLTVRGPNYNTDKKKINPGSAICKCMLTELYEVEKKDGDRHDHIAQRGLAKQRMEAIAALGNPFQIIINLQIPGDPPVSITSYFAVPPEFSANPDNEQYMSLLNKFINIPMTEEERLILWGIKDGNVTGSESQAEEQKGFSNWKMPSDISWPDPHELGAFPGNDFRNNRFKLVPLVTEGPWIIKATVPMKPALLGKKIAQRYFRGERYFEMDLHIGSSAIASQIVGLCRGYSKLFSTDLGVVIQGEDPDELPERVLACVSLNKVDIDCRKKLD